MSEKYHLIVCLDGDCSPFIYLVNQGVYDLIDKEYPWDQLCAYLEDPVGVWPFETIARAMAWLKDNNAVLGEEAFGMIY